MKLLANRDEASCREVLRYLDAYLDGEVSLGLAARIGRHLDACRRCGLDAQVHVAIKRSLSRRQAGADQLAVRRLRVFAAHLSDGDNPHQP